ncbi:glycosyltransferase family 4 protein [Rhodophyticola sp. CCM32]|uniref:glycosyltransferase family 4 protein n=1 Tax=Rhodophyticola sp. CCM32 TaxID=2916397 RepID=UPI00143DC7F7|nr:glycosyltransferase family 4 protein [Rhodophyticola sp. CCM32]
MKVCVIGLRGLPDVSGGIETHCENLYERLARARPDLDIVVYGRTPYIGKKPYETSAGIRVVPAFALRNKYLETITNTFVAIIRARFGERADCVHIHAIGPGLLAPFARLLGMPVILTHHGDDFLRDKWNSFARTILRFGERIGVASAKRVIAVSPSLAERLKQDYPGRADRIHYIPNGADHIVARGLAADGDAVLQKFDLSEGKYIISVGRLVPEKGFADLIRAHKASGTDLPLVIVGGQSNSDHDQELAALDHDNLLMTGTLPQAEVAQLLVKTRLFILASHHEGLPIAALEAWAMGAPLLLSDIVPNRDLGLPQDHYFPVRDVDALAERLRTDALGLPAIELLAAFNWTSIARHTADIYDLLHDPQPAEAAGG